MSRSSAGTRMLPDAPAVSEELAALANRRCSRIPPEQSPSGPTSWWIESGNHGRDNKDDAARSACRASGVNVLSASQLDRLSQLYALAIKTSTPRGRTENKRRSRSTHSSVSSRQPGGGDAEVEDDQPATSRWKQGMKEVLLRLRSTDAITNINRVKHRKLTYWHGLKIKKTSKQKISSAIVQTLETKCRSILEILEESNRGAAEKELLTVSESQLAPKAIHTAPSFNSESLNNADDRVAASPEQISLVFGFFSSVPELIHLDSIHKKQLFRELRIMKFAAGSTVFNQWEACNMVCVILDGSVRLTSRHTGVLFQAGTLDIGEVIGSATPSIARFTARCMQATKLLCLDCDRFSVVVNDSVSAERIAKKELLRCSTVFSMLGDEDLNTLEPLFTQVRLEDNQVLCAEGSRVDHVYVVKLGFIRILKAFVWKECRRPKPPPPRAGPKASSDTVPRPPSRASSRTTFANRGAEPTQGEVRLRHFDVGEIGPKGMLGENGLVTQQNVPSSTPPMASAAAPAPALTQRTTSGRNIHNDPEGGDEGPEKQPKGTPIGSSSSSSSSSVQGEEGGKGEEGRKEGDGSDALLSPNGTLADGGGSSSPVAFRSKKAAYIVSGVASGGRAEVYVAKVHDLKKLQTDSFRFAWKIAQRLHQVRTQGWDAKMLAQQLQGQLEWDAVKRDVLSQI